LIIRLELAFTKHMADGVDTPGSVVQEKNPYKTTPEQTWPTSNLKWNQQSQRNPEPVSAIGKDHYLIL
jgi:hypothetical protein